MGCGCRVLNCIVVFWGWAGWFWLLVFVDWLFVLVDLVGGDVCVLVVIMRFGCLGLWLHDGSCTFDLGGCLFWFALLLDLILLCD